ncbi:MAG: hypothetical protein QG622_1901, partial [Actinomycetota bacterium]|nr:hypothetical protein [Actinomycetota bacterium]
AATEVAYDDGFGPLPPLQPAAQGLEDISGPGEQPGEQPGEGVGSRLDVDPESRGIEGGAGGDAPPPVAATLVLTTGEYDRVSRAVPSPAFTAGRAGTAVDRIVIHITDAPTTSSTVSHFTRADADSSAHYLVGQDGEVIQFVSEDDTAWHARGVNRRSIGIEHVAVKQGGVTYGGTTFGYLPPTDLEYEESAALVAHLCEKYGLTPDRTTIIGHREADPSSTHTSCPDGAWDWDHFLRLVTTGVCSPQPAAQALGLPAGADRHPASVTMDAATISVSPEQNRVTAPHVETVSQLRSIAIQALLAANPVLTPLVLMARAAAEAGGVSVGIGPQISAGLLAGGGLGAGIIFAPGNVMGVYGQVEADAGFIASIGASIQLTVISGGVDAFGGLSYVAGISGGEGFTGGAAALFDEQRRFLGVTLQVGVGAGLSPVDVYVGVQRAVARQLGMPRTLNAEDWSINWDDVFVVGQPTENSCWATAAAMIDGWRRRQSVSVDRIAEFDNLSVGDNGLLPTSAVRFAQAIGFTAQPAACYTPEGFRSVLEANGPIWIVAKIPDSHHAIVITGMYRQDGRFFVRVTDPWDRVIGTPGTPGPRTSTHVTGSRYIMTYDAFAAEFETAGSNGWEYLLHTGGTHGHLINRGSAAGVGYALAFGAGSPSFGAPPNHVGELRLESSTALTRTMSQQDGRRYDLPRLSGFVEPSNAQPGGTGMPPLPGERVVLDDWPYIEGPSGRVQAGVMIDWRFRDGAVGEVSVAPLDGQVSDGWTAAVRADITSEGSTGDRVTLRVRVTTAFSRPGEQDQVAVTDVMLHGDGRRSIVHGVDQVPEPASPAEGAADHGTTDRGAAETGVLQQPVPA